MIQNRDQQAMTAAQTFSRKDVFYLLVICAIVFWLYAPAVNSVVVFDDAQFIRDGRLRTDLLSALPRYVTNATFTLVARLSDASIAAQKMFNIALHCGVVSLLLLFTKGMLRTTVGDADAPHTAAHFTADDIAIKVGVAFFALGPVAVYSVAYMAQRTIPLATFFTLAMAISCLRALTLRKPAWFALALACYALAVLSKELAIAAIFIPAVLYIQIHKPKLRKWLVPAVCASLLAGLVAYYYLTQYQVALMVPYEPAAIAYVAQLNAMHSDSGAHILLLNALNQSNLFFGYALLWLIPNPQWMAIDLHPLFPTMDQARYYFPLALAYAAGGVASAWLLFGHSKERRLLGALLLIPWLFFAIELFIVRLQEPFVLYRSYLWAIALPGLMALALKKIKKPGLLAAIGAVLVLAAGAASYNRIQTFSDNFLVWSDAIQTSERYAFFRGFGTWRAYINRGSAYLGQHDVRHALEDFNHADRLDALNGVAKFNTGVVLQTLGQHELAIAMFKDAERDNHQDPMLQYHAAESYYALQQFDSAITYYGAALALAHDPATRALARTREAETLVALKRFAQAKPLFDELLAGTPGDMRATIGRGMACIGLGDFALAEQSFNDALRIAPSANAYYGMALVRASQSRWRDAHAAVEQALIVEPDNAIYREYERQLSAQH